MSRKAVLKINQQHWNNSKELAFTEEEVKGEGA